MLNLISNPTFSTSAVHSLFVGTNLAKLSFAKTHYMAAGSFRNRHGTFLRH